MMRKVLLIVIFCLAALLLQILIVPLISIKGIRPDFILLLTLFYARLEGRLKGAIFGFLLGLLVDTIGMGSFLGLSSLSKTISGFLSGNLKGRKYHINPLIFQGVNVVIIFAHFLLFFLINFMGVDLKIQSVFLSYIIPTSLYTLVFYFLFDYLIPGKK